MNPVTQFLDSMFLSCETTAQIYSTLRAPFLYSPAAASNHHNYPCGLGYHMFEMIKLCQKIDEDLFWHSKEDILLGILLHDIEKLFTYDELYTIESFIKSMPDSRTKWNTMAPVIQDPKLYLEILKSKKPSIQIIAKQRKFVLTKKINLDYSKFFYVKSKSNVEESVEKIYFMSAIDQVLNTKIMSKITPLIMEMLSFCHLGYSTGKHKNLSPETVLLGTSDMISAHMGSYAYPIDIPKSLLNYTDILMLERYWQLLKAEIIKNAIKF